MRSANRLCSYLVLAGLGGLCLTAAGQDFGNRWEGLKSEFNSRPKYQIRAVFADDDVASANRNAVLRISYYVPPDATVSGVQAWELHDVLNYQMRPKQLPDKPDSWVTFAPWPVRDVLAPNGIAPSSLGVLIRLRDAQTPELFAPALLYTETPPRQVSAYTIYLTSDTAVAHVRCLVRDKNGSLKGANRVPYSCTLADGAHSFPGKLPAKLTINAADLPAGLVSVTILGEYPDDESGDALHAEVHFFHQPKVELAK